MVFYKIDVQLSKEEAEREYSRQEWRAIAGEFAEKSETLCQQVNQQNMIFTASKNEGNLVLGMISRTQSRIENQIEKYLEAVPLACRSYSVEEITFSALESLLSSSRRSGYVRDDEEILERFEISALSYHNGGCEYGEAIIDNTLTLEECKKTASDLLYEETLLPEIDRILLGKKQNCEFGHPVHYLLQTDDRESRKTIYKTLLSVLYANGRIKNKRYSFVDFCSESHFPGNGFTTLYRTSEGGAVVIRYTDSDEKENGFAKRGTDIIASICETASKYKNKVLTIICLPSGANNIKNEFFVNWENASFIELFEDVAFGENAVKYLKSKAQEQKIRFDKKLISGIEEGKGYTSSELNRIFDFWYAQKLKNDIYPQYKISKTGKEVIKNDDNKGNSYQKLEELIGLEGAKTVMKNSLNYFKVQKIFADRGIIDERPSMHMVFTGNPGTAKTTVARLFTSIMKENGLISNGNLYEVGRADLVGKYVGSTAPLVKNAFRRAKGGVLFIDEAYSLVDDRDGLFGDEAINTIVQEMENNRKDTVVIFAGYPDKMEGFLNKNPGLRSRIAFHIPFEDYSVNELCEIAKLIAKEKKLNLSDCALKKLESIFETAIKNSDFGNGRFVRNIIEKAKISQANRIIKMDIEKITDEELVTIIAEDLEEQNTQKDEKVIKIGFCA